MWKIIFTLKKIHKIVAELLVLVQISTKSLGAPFPTGRAYSAPTDSLAVREGKGREERKGKRKGWEEGRG